MMKSKQQQKRVVFHETGGVVNKAGEKESQTIESSSDAGAVNAIVRRAAKKAQKKQQYTAYYYVLRDLATRVQMYNEVIEKRSSASPTPEQLDAVRSRHFPDGPALLRSRSSSREGARRESKTRKVAVRKQEITGFRPKGSGVTLMEMIAEYREKFKIKDKNTTGSRSALQGPVRPSSAVINPNSTDTHRVANLSSVEKSFETLSPSQAPLMSSQSLSNSEKVIKKYYPAPVNL